jgi:DNA-binding MurR/RpiR family transcriptional regulator
MRRGHTLNSGQDAQRTLGGGWDDLAYLAQVIDALRRSRSIAGHGSRQTVATALTGQHYFDRHGVHEVLSHGFSECVVEIGMAEMGSPAADDGSHP